MAGCTSWIVVLEAWMSIWLGDMKMWLRTVSIGCEGILSRKKNVLCEKWTLINTHLIPSHPILTVLSYIFMSPSQISIQASSMTIQLVQPAIHEVTIQDICSDLSHLCRFLRILGQEIFRSLIQATSSSRRPCASVCSCLLQACWMVSSVATRKAITWYPDVETRAIERICTMRWW